MLSNIISCAELNAAVEMIDSCNPDVIMTSFSMVKGEVHSRMAIYFLYVNKKFIKKYVIHQNFSFQRALNPYEIVL